MSIQFTDKEILEEETGNNKEEEQKFLDKEKPSLEESLSPSFEKVPELSSPKIKDDDDSNKKKEKTNNEKARFDFVFMKRFLYIFFTRLGVYFPVQILCFILIIVFSFGNSYLEYFFVLQYSNGISTVGSGDFAAGWTVVMYLTFSAIGRLFCELMVKNGWITYFLFYDWRKRLTTYLLKNYFHQKNYYVILNLQDNKIDNPDQRIHSDTSDFCKNLSIFISGVVFYMMSVFFNLYNLILTKYYIILIPIFAIPIISAIVYAILFSTVSKSVFQKDTIEGDFRFSHARIREHSESMAFFKSEELEKGIVSQVFNKLISTLRKFSFKLFFLNTYTQITYYLPSGVFLMVLVYTAFVSKTYPFNGKLSADEETAALSQIYMFAQNLAQALSNALKLNQNLSVVIGNTARIGGMIEAMRSINKKVEKISKKNKSDQIVQLEEELGDNEEISFEGVNISTPSGKRLFNNLSFRIKKGQSLIIMGPSGTGKSSILRVLCGLWDYEGKIRKTNVKNMFFLPQKPYLIQGNLKQNIIYPKTLDEVNVSDEEIERVMSLANIQYLLKRASLHEEDVAWEEKLSLGEMQRIAMARLYFHSPSWAVLDECTSALDPENEKIVYENAVRSGITLISVAHRKSVARFHDVILEVGADTPEKYRFTKLSSIKGEPPSFEWHRQKYYQPEQVEIVQEYASRVNVEKSDGRLGNTGINATFFKRVYRLLFKKIMVKGVWNWVFVVFLVFCCLAFALTPLIMVMGSSPMMMYILQRDLKNTLIFGIMLFLGFAAVGVGAGIVFFLFSMQGILFRKNVTRYIHDRYFKNRMFFNMNSIDKTIDNVDQRICSDVDLMTSGFEFNPGASFMEQQLFTSVFQCAAFLIVGFSSSWAVGIASVVILIVAGIMQVIFMVIISKLRFIQQKREGFMRFSLTRMKEYSEQIAFYNGIHIEEKVILERFNKVLKNQVYLYGLQSLSDSLVEFVNRISSPVAFILIILSIYTGIISLSSMQPSEVIALVQLNVGVMGNIIFAFIGALRSFMMAGDIVGTIGRVGEFIEKMDEIDNLNEKHVEDDLGLRVNEPAFVGCQNLNGYTPNRKPLFSNLTFRLDPGKSLLIKGDSGCGKSSLLRMIGGLWKIDNGKIFAPQEIGAGGIFFLPQKPYLILGSLKEQIIYPDKDSSTSDEGLREILKKVNLDYIFERLGEDWNTKKEWSVVLSPGEQQRLSVARLLYHRPKFAILDECTSSLDEENEKICYEIVKNEGISYISVGHRQTLGIFHDFLLKFQTGGGWAYKEKTGRRKEIKEL